MRYIIKLLFFIAIFIHSVYALDVIKFDNKSQEQRYYTLVSEIRCPVCQGQSIGGSNAGLAQDLRTQVVKMLKENKTNTQIKAFMIDRYGDFASFTPPVKNTTILLWFAPIIFVIIALIVVFFRIKSRKKQTTTTIDTSGVDKYLE